MPTASNREGFFAPLKDPSSLLPTVTQGQPWNGQDEFLWALKVMEERATRDNDVQAYRGWSGCRVCGLSNGSQEFRHRGWAWPEGLRHYVQAHNYRPSLAFIEFVRGVQLD